MAEDANTRTAKWTNGRLGAGRLGSARGLASELPLLEIDGEVAPAVPTRLVDTGVGAEVLTDLALKLAYTMATFTTTEAAMRLYLPQQMVVEMLDQLKRDRLVEVLGAVGRFDYRFEITERGREHARRLLEISGYVGPAPVALEYYVAFLEWQLARLPKVLHDEVAAALSMLVLPEAAIQIAGLAAESGRSLFLYGPPGNGKTSVGHLLHEALRGELWIPYAIGIGENVISLFDPQCHTPAPLDLSPEKARLVDQRWLRISRPFIAVAGELTLEALDLTYVASRGYYEAPLHVKANGGVFLLDDFGYQRVEPRKLLSRWIFPLENQVDHLTLRTGQKLSVPFRQILIVSTNLDPEAVMDPAFLRRMGYRLYLGDPTPAEYEQIFARCAGNAGAVVPAGLIERLIERSRAEGRPLRSCQPRDLIERASDICRFHSRPLELSDETVAVAWAGYFGDPTHPR